MNRHVGASFALSVFFVGFFAVVLYRPEREPPTAPKAATAAPVVAKPVPTVASPRPVPTPSVPFGDDLYPSGPGGPRISLAALEPAGPAEAVTAVPRREANRVRPVARLETAPTAAPAPRAREAFTQIGEGETLDDVARRVYGTTEQVPLLRRANRDVLSPGTTTVAAGTLLRTP